MAYYHAGAIVADPWSEPASPDGRTMMTPAEWLERRGDPALPAMLGLALQPGFSVETLADDVGRFALITVGFPKFTDGRGYSMAWILRSRLGYRGELRAIGDVLFDEMQFMVRCGFDAFEVEDAQTVRLLREGRRGVLHRFYQPGLEPEIPEGTRPWARRLA